MGHTSESGRVDRRLPRLPLLNQDRLAPSSWLDVRDATNRPVPFWVRSEAGPTAGGSRAHQIRQRV